MEGECVRQAGASGLFAKVRVDFEPHPRRANRSRCSGTCRRDELPPEFLAAAEQGIRGALESGELGYPVMNVRAIIRGGEMDQQFSNETAFQAAGADAVRKAMRDNIVLLEPVMRVEVTVPEEFLGPVTADLNARRARSRSCHSRGNAQRARGAGAGREDVRLRRRGAQPEPGPGVAVAGAALLPAGAAGRAGRDAAPGRLLRSP